MLVLVRKIGEEIVIGDDVRVVYLGDVGRGRVKIGVVAPLGVEVDRLEVRKNKNKEKARAKE